MEALISRFQEMHLAELQIDTTAHATNRMKPYVDVSLSEDASDPWQHPTIRACYRIYDLFGLLELTTRQ